MSTPSGERRASYGPRSPVVGARGARTRQQLLDAALEQFGGRGFHATTVDDIARAAGVSRATLYQYFDSREEIVTELLEECGAALLRVVRRVGPLSATSEGYDNLHWWLGEWGYVYDKYATMFVEWAHIDSPQTPLRPLIARFVEGYTARLSARIEQSGVTGLHPDHAAIALVTVIERLNYYRSTRDLGVDDRQLLDTLAVVVQLVLFPQTPFAALALSEDSSPHPERVPSYRRAQVAVEPVAEPAGPPPTASAAAQRSVELLLAAGAQVFATNGYRGSNVDQILAVAGLSRRTFYKYFDNRFELLRVLSQQCLEAVSALAAEFEALRHERDPAALRAWVAHAVRFQAQHGSVLRIWLEEPVDGRLVPGAAVGVRRLLDAFASVLGAQPQPPGQDVTAASRLLLALVERFPHQGVGTRYEVRGDDLIEVMTAFIARGMLGRPAHVTVSAAAPTPAP